MDLLLVGGGHASMALLKRAKKWSERGLHITLLNDHPYLYYSGMVPEYLGGVYTPEDVKVDLRAWCEYANIDWVRGRARRLDIDSRTVETSAGAGFQTDVVVFDIGAQNPCLDAAGALPTKPLYRLEQLRSDIIEADKTSSALKLAIAGGGAAGVEIALNISARMRSDLSKITIIEPASRLLPTFPRGMSAHAEASLSDRNVMVRTQDSVAGIRGDQVTLVSGDALDLTDVLWATGSVGPDIFRNTGLTCSPKGFIHVDETLQHARHSWLFAAGDCASVRGYEDLDRVGVHAVKQGPVLAANVEKPLFGGGKMKPFRPYPVAPLILSTGTDEALWSAGNVWLRGALMLRLKHLVDINWMDRAREPESARRPLFDRMHARHP